jgi:hypothetical protein
MLLEEYRWNFDLVTMRVRTVWVIRSNRPSISESSANLEAILESQSEEDRL